MKTRMTIKQELQSISKFEVLDQQLFDYFMQHVDNVKFTDRELIYLIRNLICGYYFEGNEYEIKLADILISMTSIKNHSLFNDLYSDAMKNVCSAKLNLLIKNNVIIEQRTIWWLDLHLEDIECCPEDYSVEYANDYRILYNIIKLQFRKQKIESIRNRRTSEISLNN